MKKFYLVILMVIVMCQTACGADKGSDSAQDVAISAFELTEENKEFLINICRTVDDFAGPAEMDDAFWRDFLFFSYTGKWGDGVEVVQIPREDLGFDETAIKVSLEEVEAYTKLVFGIEWPDIEPAFEEMSEGQTACYYEEGFYYIGVSDFPDYQFNLIECTVYEEDETYAIVKYSIDCEDEINIGTETLTLKPTDNENHFIIISKKREFSPDFL